MNADAILGAIRGVIRGELGSIRTVPEAVFGEGLPASLEGGDAARRLRVTAKRSFDVEPLAPRRSNAVGPSSASRTILQMDVRVTLVYALALIADTVSYEHRFEVRAQAAEDAVTVTQALEWPGNLAVDGTGAATGLVSQRLSELAPRVVREDWRAGLYEVELRFRALVLERQLIRIISPLVTHEGDFLVTSSGDLLVAASL